jgi:hypothetical protein
MRGVSRFAIVVDTVARSMTGGDENSSVDMGQFVDNCTRLERELAALVLAVHHKPSGGSKPRGHTSLLGAVDVSIDVIKPEDGGVKSWTVRASKLGREGIGSSFKLEQVVLGHDGDGDAITTCVVKASDEAPRAASEDKGPRRSDQQEIALRALRNAIVDFGELAPAGLKLPKGIRVVNARHWKAEFLKMAFDEEPESATFRQAVKRVGDALLARGVIGRANPFIWIVRKDAE